MYKKYLIYIYKLDQNIIYIYYDYISHNITECPFVALVCIGKHNHPSPPPEGTPNGTKNNFK